jgi:hypothetical protein
MARTLVETDDPATLDLSRPGRPVDPDRLLAVALEDQGLEVLFEEPPARLIVLDPDEGRAVVSTA